MYRSNCCTTTHTQTLSAANTPAISIATIETLLKQIYNSTTVDKKALFKATFSHLAQGVINGYGKALSQVAFNSPDFKMLNQLSYNVGVFAAFKNHNQIQDTVKLLKDADGNLRNWTQFKAEALKLNDTYNTQWLNTEYNQAVTSARAAKRWQNIQGTKALYPNLQYISVNDDRTRALHKKWHGIILPVDHVFWNTHYTPNDYGCRCTVRRTDKPVDTKGYTVNNMPNLPPQFNQNVGKTGKVFNNEHPYFRTKNYKQVAQLARKALINTTQKHLLVFARQHYTKPFKVKGISEAVEFSAIGIRKHIDRNKRQKDWYQTVNLFYEIMDLIEDLYFVFEPAVKGIQKTGTEGRYIANKKIGQLNYEVCFKKTVSKTYFYYLKRVK